MPLVLGLGFINIQIHSTRLGPLGRSRPPTNRHLSLPPPRRSLPNALRNSATICRLTTPAHLPYDESRASHAPPAWTSPLSRGASRHVWGSLGRAAIVRVGNDARRKRRNGAAFRGSGKDVRRTTSMCDLQKHRQREGQGGRATKAGAGEQADALLGTSAKCGEPAKRNQPDRSRWERNGDAFRGAYRAAT